MAKESERGHQSGSVGAAKTYRSRETWKSPEHMNVHRAGQKERGLRPEFWSAEARLRFQPVIEPTIVAVRPGVSPNGSTGGTIGQNDQMPWRITW